MDATTWTGAGRRAVAVPLRGETEVRRMAKTEQRAPTRAAAALAVVMAFGPVVTSLAAQAPCDARPRWLAVTVVGGWSLFTDGGERVGETIDIAGPQLRLLDRCWLGESPYIGPVNPLYRDSLDDHQAIWTAGGRTVIRATNSDENQFYPFHVLYLRETVQDICAAMDDCGDATGR